MQPLPTKEQQNKSGRSKVESEFGLYFYLFVSPIDQDGIDSIIFLNYHDNFVHLERCFRISFRTITARDVEYNCEKCN